MMTDEEKCGNCHFLRHFDTCTRHGECHKNPPQMILSSGNTWAAHETVFPKVEAIDWCGCWKNKEV